MLAGESPEWVVTFREDCTPTMQLCALKTRTQKREPTLRQPPIAKNTRETRLPDQNEGVWHIVLPTSRRRPLASRQLNPEIRSPTFGRESEKNLTQCESGRREAAELR